MRKQINLLSLFLFLTAASFAQSKGGYVTMVVTQSFNPGGKSNIIITHGEGNTEQVELKNLKMGFENFAGNEEVMTQQMNKLKEEGYRLITSNSNALSPGAIMVTTYIFGKD